MDVVFAILLLIASPFVFIGINKLRRWLYRNELRDQAKLEMYHAMNYANAQREAADQILREAGQKP